MTFEECFDLFRVSACRLETLPRYADDDARFAPFREGRPVPERSVRTSPYLRRIAETTGAGKHWSRVYLVDDRNSDRTRYKLTSYMESAAAGEAIWIAERSPALASLRTDFWLFDAETGGPFAAIMEYGPGGRYLGARVTAEAGACIAARDLAFRHAVPLDRYLETAVA